MSDVMNTGPYEERSPSVVMKLRDMLEEDNDGCMLGRREGWSEYEGEDVGLLVGGSLKI